MHTRGEERRDVDGCGSTRLPRLRMRWSGSGVSGEEMENRTVITLHEGSQPQSLSSTSQKSKMATYVQRSLTCPFVLAKRVPRSSKYTSTTLQTPSHKLSAPARLARSTKTSTISPPNLKLTSLPDIPQFRLHWRLAVRPRIACRIPNSLPRDVGRRLLINNQRPCFGQRLDGFLLDAAHEVGARGNIVDQANDLASCPDLRGR